MLETSKRNLLKLQQKINKNCVARIFIAEAAAFLTCRLAVPGTSGVPGDLNEPARATHLSGASHVTQVPGTFEVPGTSADG